MNAVIKLVALVTLLLLLFSCSEKEKALKNCPVSPRFSYQLTGNAGCFIVQENKILLVRDLKSGLWGFPAGSGIKGETAMCTAHRETLEEAGVHVEVAGLLANFENENFYLFKCQTNDKLTDLKIPEKSRSEISSIKLIDLNTLSQKDWRFGDQFALVQRLFKLHMP